MKETNCAASTAVRDRIKKPGFHWNCYKVIVEEKPSQILTKASHDSINSGER